MLEREEGLRLRVDPPDLALVAADFERDAAVLEREAAGLEREEPLAERADPLALVLDPEPFDDLVLLCPLREPGLLVAIRNPSPNNRGHPLLSDVPV